MPASKTAKPAKKKASRAKRKAEVERVPGPERATKDAERVALAAANTAASKAGVIEEIETNVDGVSLAVIDGARAYLGVGKCATEALTQAELLALRQAIDRAVQSTY